MIASAVSLASVIACGVSKDQNGIDIGIVQDHVQRKLIAVRQGIAQHVNGIVAIRRGRKIRCQLLDRLIGQLGEGQPSRSMASAAMIPAPPALVRTTTLDPWGNG